MLSQDTKDLLKLSVLVMTLTVVIAGALSVRAHVQAIDHTMCIQAASEEGVDGPTIVLLCGKL